MEVRIRWMIRRDMPEILNIERESFEYPWAEDDFTCCLRQKNCIGMVAEVKEIREIQKAEKIEKVEEDVVVGYMIYELHKTILYLLNFAVSPTYRCKGVGTYMVNKLISKLSADHRTKISLNIGDTNLRGHVFFKNRGFKAVSVLRNFFEYNDAVEDAYIMVYRFCPKSNSLITQ